MIKIGVVNIDVSHPKTFSEELKKDDRARYTAVFNEGFRGREEVEGFFNSAGLEKICSSIDELVEVSDVGFIQGCNWDKHVEYAEDFIKAGKPVFIDKPIVGNVKDCKKLLELEKNGAIIMGSSSVRYCNEISEYLNMPENEKGKLLHISATVGVDEFNYAIHAVEGICAVAESAPVSVKFIGVSEREGQKCESYFVTFENGATATYHVVEDRFLLFHLTFITTKKDYCVTLDNYQLYGPMLNEICNKVEGKKSRIASMKELTDSIRVMLAGKLSKEKNGEKISVYSDELENISFDGYAFEKKYAAAASPMYI